MAAAIVMRTRRYPVPGTENDVDKLLIKLGLPVYLAGFEYIKAIIEMKRGGLMVWGDMTNEVYDAVAVRYNKTPRIVERNIRTAIKAMFASVDHSELKETLGVPQGMHVNRITPINFIALVCKLAG